jgi:hypothetical protein
MDILAVVSKAIFEKQALVGGRRVGIGDTWPTALYASTNAGLEPLSSGGSLFLVTVRPGDALWLVAILDKPVKAAEGWIAAPNTTPVRAVTSAVPKLRFSTGKGLTVAPGKHGMSLQTPRQLTPKDADLLRGASRPADRGAEPAAVAQPDRSLLGRYLGGETRAVWDELRALGARAQDDEHHEEALEIARETMRRARNDIDLIAERLPAIGYRFANPERARVPPTPGDLEAIVRFEREVGPLPLSLRAYFEIVGAVDFTQAYAQMERGANEPSSLRALGARDPLLLPGAAEFLSDRTARDAGPKRMAFFMDACEKTGAGGDYVYVELPRLSSDCLLDAREPFVDYLRNAVTRGGFRGHAHQEEGDTWGHGIGPARELIAPVIQALVPF